MKKYFLEISEQNFKEYLWPDIKTSIGNKTALYQGALTSFFLAIIYGLLTLKYYIYGITLPPTLSEVLESEELQEFGLFGSDTYVSLKILFSFLCFVTALFYIRSIAIKKSKVSIVFLFIWMSIELISSYSNSSLIMIFVYSLLFLGSLNCYRSMRP